RRGQLVQLIRDGARTRGVTGSEHDLDSRRQQPRATSLKWRLGQYARDGSLRRLGAALRQPQQGEARLWLVASLACLVVSTLGQVELARKPMHLALLIQRTAGQLLAGGSDRAVLCTL